MRAGRLGKYYRLGALFLITLFVVAWPLLPEPPAPTVPLVERPAALDQAIEEDVRRSVLAVLPGVESAEFFDLRVVDYVDLQGFERWAVCGSVEPAGGGDARRQTFAYAPHTKIARLGPGITRPQEACAGQE